MIRATAGRASGLKAAEVRWEGMTKEELLSLASTASLLGRETYLFVGALSGEKGDAFLSVLKELAASPHLFVFEEEKLLKKEMELLQKAGAKIDVAVATKKEWVFDPFGVAEALGKRDRKQLWISLMRALRAGEKAEMLAGLMAWKARQMKDVALSRELTFMYHDSHRGAGDLELLLERFVLKF